MVTSENIREIMSSNFSGTLHNKQYSVEEFVNILNRYSHEDSLKLREIALEYFSAEKQIQTLIDIYYKQVNRKVEPLNPIDRKILDSFISSIAETRAYSNFYYDYEKSVRIRSFWRKLIKTTLDFFRNSIYLLKQQLL